MARTKIEKLEILESDGTYGPQKKLRIKHNELADRVNAIDEDILTIAKKQNVVIDRCNEMAEQVNVCRELLQKFVNAIPQAGGEKPKDIIVP